VTTFSPNTKRSKRPPISPTWGIAAAIGTIVLLGLTAWQLLATRQEQIVAKPPIGKRTTQEQPTTESSALESQQLTAPDRQEPADRETAKPSQSDEATAAENSSHPKPPPTATKTEPAKAADKMAPSIESNREDSRGAESAAAGLKTETPATQNAAPMESPKQAENQEKAGKKDAEKDANQIIVESLRAKEKQNAAQRGTPETESQEDETEVKAPDQPPWLSAAKEFAAKRHGRVLDAKPFPGGSLRLTAGFDAEQIDASLWCIGGGWLETESGVYPFGLGYERMPPTVRQEIPGLAEKLGLASARIEIKPRGDDLLILAVGTPQAMGMETFAGKRTEIAPLQNKLDQLTYQLHECRRLENLSESPETKKKKDALHEAILGLLEQADVNRSSLDAAENLAKEEIGKLQRRIQELRAESNDRSTREQEDGKRAVERFTTGCRKITVIIYQSEKPKPGDAKEPPAKAAVKPPASQPPASQPTVVPLPKAAEPASNRPADLKATPGVAQCEVEYREETSADAFTPTYTEMGKLTVQVVSSAGAALPKWFQDDYNANCTIWEYPREGTPRTRELAGVGKANTHTITTGTSQIAVRCWFSRKNAPAGEGNRPAAETPWHIIDPVVSGTEYRLKAPLTPEVLASLQIKPIKPVKPAKPAKPSSGAKTKSENTKTPR